MNFFNSLKSKYSGLASTVNPTSSIHSSKNKIDSIVINRNNFQSILNNRNNHYIKIAPQQSRKRFTREFIHRNIPDISRYSLWQQIIFHEKCLNLIYKNAPNKSIIKLPLPTGFYSSATPSSLKEISNYKKESSKLKYRNKFKSIYNSNIKSGKSMQSSYKKIIKKSSPFKLLGTESFANELKPKEVKEDDDDSHLDESFNVGEINISVLRIADTFIECGLYDQIVTWPLFQLIRWKKGLEQIEEANEFLKQSEIALKKFFDAVKARDIDFIDQMLFVGEFKDDWFSKVKSFYSQKYVKNNLVMVSDLDLQEEFNDSLVYSWFDEDGTCDVVTAHKFYAKHVYSILDKDGFKLVDTNKHEEKNTYMYFCVVQWQKDIEGEWRIKSIGAEFTI